MTAGTLERDNTAGYNCNYMPVDDPKSFDEAMYILLCGQELVSLWRDSMSINYRDSK